MAVSKRDWVGHWFRLMQERGYEMVFRCGCVIGPGEKDIEWHRLPHWEFDGVGAFVSLLRARGLNPVVPVLPPRRRGAWYARWIVKIRGIVSYFRLVPIHAAFWKKLRDAAPVPRGTHPAEISAHRILSEEDTLRLIAICREQGVSVHSRLHWALAETVRGELAPGSGPHLWMVPVNMRGAVKRIPDTSNQQSLVWVDTEAVGGPKDIDVQIEKRFREAIHWGAWLLLNIGKLIGEKGMRRLLDRVDRVGDRWVGTFSNMGAWNVDSPPWIGFVPTSRSSPLGATCLTVKGRMSLALQAQAELCDGSATLESWLDQWVTRALSGPR